MLLVIGLLVIGGVGLVSRCGGPTYRHRPCRRTRKGLFSRCHQHTFAVVTVTDLAGLGLFAAAYGLWTLAA
ncbi:hypothetical protein GCM10009753_72550 [Streptantibioticus ferralitis]